MDMSYLNEGTRRGILSWILSTDHKRIGILYLSSMVFLFFIAVTIGVLMRIEQLTPHSPLFSPQIYNAFFTVHGVIMIFMFVLPGHPAVFGNFFLPIMIGARDVSFPRLNLMSWYFFIAGAALVITSLFTGNGPPDTGWTFYAPYSLRSGGNITLGVFGALASHAAFRLVLIWNGVDSAACNTHHWNYVASHNSRALVWNWSI
jgi:cytochrome c oxidase subunit 1